MSTEDRIGEQIRHLVNQGLDIDPATEERLRAAREQALARRREAAEPARQWAGGALALFGGWAGVSLRLVLPAALLVAGVATLYVWQQNQNLAEAEEIDAELLSDELPIDAYLDRGFQDWLKKRTAQE